MICNQRGAARLIRCLATAGAFTLVVPPSLLFGPSDQSDRSKPSPGAPASSAPWRPQKSSVEDALRDFLNRRPQPLSSAEQSAASVFRPRRENGARSKLLAYAPADGQLDLNASQDPAPIDAAALLGEDFEAFSRALASFKAGDFAAGDQAGAAIKNPLPLTTAQWAGLRLHPREAGFSRLSRFLTEHPNWPAADWIRLRVEEALFGDKHSDKLVRAYFSAGKPRTPAGKLALARVLLREDNAFEVAALIKEVWREDDLNGTLENAVKKEFGGFLSVADHKYRADRLLYAEKTGAALRAAELAGKDIVRLAHARAAAANDKGNEKIFASLPASLQNDPGVLFARIHTLRQGKKITEAVALMRAAPREAHLVIDGNAWWTERRLLARKLLDKGDFATAYLLCAQHSARSAVSRVEAEFHAGWIALRFLRDAAKADRHFDLLAKAAETPIQKSRAAYWRGRAAESYGTADNLERARGFFRQAAVHSTTFYGQMARAKLGVADSPLRRPPQPAEGDARDEAVRAVELLFAAGEKEIAAPLAGEAAKRLKSEAQVAALADITVRQRDAKISLALGKLASYRGIALDDAAFPAYGVPQFAALPGSASLSIVYAIARQESAFDPRAVSGAGAMGLMQMIASTARTTARQTGVGFELKRLIDEPAFNAQLGAAHLGMLLGEHKGSYILAFAAYNAGGKRVKEWIDAYGDPRRKEVDPIDWVERIPFSETRNYVQRVIENLVVYRAKFGERQIRPPQVDLAHAEAPM